MLRFASWLRVTAGAVLFVASAAAADPVVVEYLVQQKALQGIGATQALTFALFSDDQCTSAIDSVALFAGDSAIQYFVDKTQRISGGAKPLKAVRIHAVIDVTPTSSAPYLKVTGPHVTPVGDDCQLQAGSPIAASTGPAGPQGDPGPQGAQGDPGPQGGQGDPGPQGAQGNAGPQGDPGAQGAQGDPGPQGVPGDPGPQGVPGDPGPQGDPGAQGAQGNPGPQGDPGPQGVQGDPGAQGVQGNPGPQGIQGIPGDPGPQGVQGDTGPQGLQGDPGPQGVQGDPGPTGPAGGTSGSLLGGNYSNQSTGIFLAVFDASSGTEDNASLPVTAGNASKLVLSLPAVLGGGSTATITVRKNGADTALTCTISAAQSSCTNLVSSIAFLDGDTLSVRYDETGNPNTRVRFSILYQAQ